MADAFVIDSTQKMNNETKVDRDLEDYSVKVLRGQADGSDVAHAERLVEWRRNNLVSLPSTKIRVTRKRYRGLS